MLKQLTSSIVAVLIASSVGAGAGAGELQQAASCLSGTGAGHLRCRPLSLSRRPENSVVPAPFVGVFNFYRLVSRGVEHRRCRLQPTCSLFAAHAAQQFGLLRGTVIGLARAQMEHSDQGGYLKREIGKDGFFIYPDPLSYWEHDHQ